MRKFVLSIACALFVSPASAGEEIAAEQSESQVASQVATGATDAEIRARLAALNSRLSADAEMLAEYFRILQQIKDQKAK